MYNLEQLRMFVEVVETGSFSACARKLGKVQSAISQGIANLEIDLNVQLFDRRTRKPSLTVEGRRLYGYAQAIMLQTEELNSAVAAIGREEEGKLHLILDSSLQLPSLGEILVRFSEQFPATALRMTALPSADIPKVVEKQQADLGLMFADLSFKQEVELGYIGSLQFHPVCAADHPLAQLDLIKVSDLIPYRQLVVRGNEGVSNEAMPDISPDIWSTDNIHSLIDWVRQGLGWTYAPSHVIDPLIETGELKKLVTSFDHKPWNMPVDLIAPKNKTMGPAQSWLYDQLVRYLLTT